MRTHILLPLALAAIGGCGRASAPAAPTPKPTGWTPSALIGWVYTEETGNEMTRRHFNSDGTAPFTFITKGQSDRAPIPPVAPLFYWSINGDGVLLISNTERPEDAFQRLELVSLSKDSADVRINGEAKATTLKRSKE
jgi:hypothetical protein